MADYTQLRSIGLDEYSLMKFDDIQLGELVEWKGSVAFKILQSYSEGIKGALLQQLVDTPATKDALREMARIQGRIETYNFLFSLPEKAVNILAKRKEENAKSTRDKSTENLVEE